MSPTELTVLKALKKECGERGECLTTTERIRDRIDARSRRAFTDRRIGRAILSLDADEYIDAIKAFRGDESYYSVMLKKKALNVKRESVRKRRDRLIKVAFTLLSALATFVISRVLVLLFS